MQNFFHGAMFGFRIRYLIRAAIRTNPVPEPRNLIMKPLGDAANQVCLAGHMRTSANNEQNNS